MCVYFRISVYCHKYNLRSIVLFRALHSNIYFIYYSLFAVKKKNLFCFGLKWLHNFSYMKLYLSPEKNIFQNYTFYFRNYTFYFRKIQSKMCFYYLFFIIYLFISFHLFILSSLKLSGNVYYLLMRTFKLHEFESNSDDLPRTSL